MLCRIGDDLKCEVCGRVVSRSDVVANCEAAASPILPASATACLPGTALKKLLASLGFSATSGCRCAARATVMDQAGCDWCEANPDQVVGWLREEAERRGLPFIDAVGMMLVRRAIKIARKNARTPPPQTCVLPVK